MEWCGGRAHFPSRKTIVHACVEPARGLRHESLSAGGVLARHATSGARSEVVTATWAADTQRAAELAEALRILGAGAPRMLGYADARVPQSAPGRIRFCEARPLASQISLATSVVFSLDGRLLATSGKDGTVQLWDPVTRTPIGDPLGHREAIVSVAFSPDSSVLALATGDRVKLYA